MTPPYAPPRNRALPWLLALLAVLIVVAGVLAFLLIREDDDAPATPAAQSASRSPCSCPTT